MTRRSVGKPKTQNPTKHSPPSQSASSLRIIGGKWRGRKLDFMEVNGLRPTGDRVRETLFNWLQFEVPGANVLDLYSGSGALGFEALSRGANQVVMLELDNQVCRKLGAHLQELGCSNGKIIATDTLAWLDAVDIAQTGTFDIIFCDPPFAKDLWQRTLEIIEQKQLLKKEGFLYLEAPKNHNLVLSNHWQIHRQKSAGQVEFYLLSAAAH